MFIIFRNGACLHTSSELVTAAQAEVECGSVGGRLFSASSAAELAEVQDVLPVGEFWAGTVVLGVDSFQLFMKSSHIRLIIVSLGEG